MAIQLALVDPDRVAETRIRSGNHCDLPAISRLISRAYAARKIPHIDQQDLEAVAGQGQLIVLQLRPNEIAAAACVVTGRGMVFLVIDPEVATPQLEHRMIGVADALCESVRSVARRN